MMKSAALLFLFVGLLLGQKAPPWDVADTTQTGQQTTFMSDPGGGFCGVPIELGDYDNDGFVDYAVAPILADGGPGGSRSDSGIVYVFKGDGSVDGVIDLANAPAGQPLATIWGAASNDYLGTEIYSADLNGDSIPDLILGASGFDANGTSRTGAVYILWGGPNLTGTIDLLTPPSWVTVIHGQDLADRLGFWVEAGDVNGDGIDDLLMSADDGNGAGNAGFDVGEAHVIYGGQTFGSFIDLANPPAGLNILTVYGIDTGDQLGSTMHSVDLDNDGFEELIVSAALNRAIGSNTGAGVAGGDGPANNRSGCGETYVIWGSASLPAVIDLAADASAMLTAGDLTIIYGADSGDYLGEELSSGNLDGDQYNDLVLGAITGDGFQNSLPNAGDTVIIWGGPQLRGQSIDMANTPAGTSTLHGEDPGDIGGDTLSVADVNADGFDDLFFAEPNGDPQRPGGPMMQAGELVILFGGPVRFPNVSQVFALSNDTQWPSRRLWGADPGDLMGYSMEGGDLDLDGYAEVFPNSMRGDGFGNAYNNAGEVGIVSGWEFSKGIATLVTPPSIGTSVDIHVVGGPNEVFIAAFSGALAPAQVIPGVGTLHLAPDTIFMLSILQTAPFFSNLVGTTDALGAGQYSVVLPNEPSLVGLRLYTAYATVNPAMSSMASIGYTTSFEISN